MYSFRNVHKIWLNADQFDYMKKLNDEKKRKLRLKFSTSEIDIIFKKINEISPAFTPRSILTRMNSAFRRGMAEDELATDDQLMNDIEMLILNNDLNDFQNQILMIVSKL